MADAALERLLAAKEVVVVCGPGGVGKTTTSAAAALMAAVQLGGKVLVLTVDPARRLATALGLDAIGNVEVQVDPTLLSAASAEPRGELWAAQLDTKQSWDELVRRHAPDERTRDAILANPLYANITSKFVHSHDYIAMERLHELHTSGRYDLIVVDTPPSRSALDFLDAPARMADFFGSRLLRWLTVPYRSRMVTFASRPFYSVADRILGSRFLEDIADFFLLFQTMEQGFVERATAVQRTLTDRRSTFVVVSTLEAASVAEARYFTAELARRDLHLGALVLNRVLPAWLRSRRAATSARRLRSDAPVLASTVTPLLPPGLADPDGVARVLAEVGGSFLDYRVKASAEDELRRELGAAPDVVATVAYLAGDITDVAGLTRIGRRLWDLT